MVKGRSEVCQIIEKIKNSKLIWLRYKLTLSRKAVTHSRQIDLPICKHHIFGLGASQNGYFC